jgi:hypothetical protein
MLHGLVAFRITDFRTRDDTDTVQYFAHAPVARLLLGTAPWEIHTPSFGASGRRFRREYSVVDCIHGAAAILPFPSFHFAPPFPQSVNDQIVSL